MVVRYFNLKQEREDVHGGIIEVDISKLEKMSNPHGDFAFTPYSFNSLGVEEGDDIYEIILPQEHVPFGNSGKAEPIGPTKILKVRLSVEGMLKFYDSNQEGFYLSEVSEKVAKKNISDAENHAYTRGLLG